MLHNNYLAINKKQTFESTRSIIQKFKRQPAIIGLPTIEIVPEIFEATKKNKTSLQLTLLQAIALVNFLSSNESEIRLTIYLNNFHNQSIEDLINNIETLKSIFTELALLVDAAIINKIIEVINYKFDANFCKYILNTMKQHANITIDLDEFIINAIDQNITNTIHNLLPRLNSNRIARQRQQENLEEVKDLSKQIHSFLTQLRAKKQAILNDIWSTILTTVQNNLRKNSYPSYYSNLANSDLEPLFHTLKANNLPEEKAELENIWTHEFKINEDFILLQAYTERGKLDELKKLKGIINPMIQTQLDGVKSELDHLDNGINMLLQLNEKIKSTTEATLNQNKFEELMKEWNDFIKFNTDTNQLFNSNSSSDSSRSEKRSIFSSSIDKNGWGNESTKTSETSEREYEITHLKQSY